MSIRMLFVTALLVMCTIRAGAQTSREPQWSGAEEETLRHFQALLRIDTRNPPGNETRAAEYLKSVLEREGIQVRTFALEPSRANLVARLKGTGRKRPILIMGHTDVVTVDSTKWKFPPFGGVRNGGYVYGRGTLDDKDNVVAGLMVMLLLKRNNVPLDRDVIFLAESGEEGTTSVGIDFMVERHFPEIDAEYCLAESGDVVRTGGRISHAAVQTLEKHARRIELSARGTAGRGSRPLHDNAIVALARAVTAVAAWQPPVRLNPTTREYFRRLATLSPQPAAARYRAVMREGTPAAAAAIRYFRRHEPEHASMLFTSISPNIIDGGFRINVIPSEATASLDVRLLPDEDPEQFLELVRRVVANPSVTVSYGVRPRRPRIPPARLDSEAFRVIESAVTRHYRTTTLPIMATGGTDMAQVRAKGVQCFGIGPLVDTEDVPQGFGAHSDQERILESELHRLVRFHYDIVNELARAK